MPESDTTQPKLFTSAIQMVLEEVDARPPSIIRAGGPPSDANRAGFTLGLENTWPLRDVHSPDDLREVVTSELKRRPVLLLAPWIRWADQNDAIEAPLARRNSVAENLLSTCSPPTSDATLAVALPAVFLESNSSREFRETMRRQWQEVVVLFATGAIVNVHRSIVVALIVFRAKESSPSELRFFQIPRNASRELVLDDLKRLLSRTGGQTDFGYVLREFPPAGDSLSYIRHDPAVRARRTDLSGFGETVRLYDLYETPRSAIHLANDRKLLVDRPHRDTARVLTGRDIRRDGTIADPDENTMWATVPKASRLAAGDLVFRAIMAPTDPSLVLAEVTDTDLPACAAHTVFVLRPRDRVPRESRKLAKLFLASEVARTLLRAEVGAPAHVTRSGMADLLIPQPDPALTSAMKELADAGRQFDEWRAQSEALLDSVFLDQTAAQARARVVESGRKLRLRVDAANLVDDFANVVRTRFPHPLSYRWRSLEALTTSGRDSDTYGEILAAAETFLCFAAQIGLAAARSLEIPVGATGEISRKLRSGKSGPGFGDWLSVLLEIGTSRAFKGLPDGHILADIRSLLKDPEVEDVTRSLTKRRNDIAHLRRSSASDLRQNTETALEELRTLYNAGLFLADTPLIQIDEIRWDNLRNSAAVQFRELMGDHPVVPTRQMSCSSNSLERDSLYLAGAAGELLLLRPFLIGRTCQVCGHWSTFHPDMAPGIMTQLKSLEHGHTSTDAELTEALMICGLL